MDDRDDFEYGPVRPYLGAAVLGAIGYVVLWIHYATIAAAITAVLFVLGAGLFTTKIVFRFENPKLTWGLTPVFGSAWLMLFWLGWKLHSLF